MLVVSPSIGRLLFPILTVACVFAANQRAQHAPQVLVPADGSPADQFGAAVAVDGDTLAIEAPLTEGGLGTVYVSENCARRAPPLLSRNRGDTRPKRTNKDLITT